MGRHYLLMAFLVSLGALQIAVSTGGYRGMWLVPHRLAARWLGIALIVVGVAVFFLQPLWVEGPWAAGSVDADSATREWGTASWGELAGARNVNDIHGGLAGTAHATWFALGALGALAVSLSVGALTVRLSRRRSEHGQADEADGLDAMREHDFPSALRTSLEIAQKSWRQDVAESLVPDAYPAGLPAIWRRVRRR